MIEYYVSKTGSAVGDGSENNPFLTLQRAVDQVGAFESLEPTIIHLGEGVWEDLTKIEKEGNFAFTSPLIIRGAEKELLPVKTATSSSNHSISVIGGSWRFDQFKDKWAYIVDGSGRTSPLSWVDYNYHRITGNTADTLYFHAPVYFNQTTQFKIVEQASILKSDGFENLISHHIAAPSGALTLEFLGFDVSGYRATRPWISSTSGTLWVNACKFSNTDNTKYKYLGINCSNAGGSFYFIQSLMRGKIRHAINLTGLNNIYINKSEIDCLDLELNQNENFALSRAAIAVNSSVSYNAVSTITKNVNKGHWLKNVQTGIIGNYCLIDGAVSGVNVDSYANVMVDGLAEIRGAVHPHLAANGARISTLSNLGLNDLIVTKDASIFYRDIV